MMAKVILMTSSLSPTRCRVFSVSPSPPPPAGDRWSRCRSCRSPTTRCGPPPSPSPSPRRRLPRPLNKTVPRLHTASHSSSHFFLLPPSPLLSVCLFLSLSASLSCWSISASQSRKPKVPHIPFNEHINIRILNLFLNFYM